MTSLRFRCWHKTTKKMYRCMGFDQQPNGDMIEVRVYDERDPGTFFSMKVEADEVILMQGTGLLDASSVEIFEGDICEIGNNIQGISLLAEVEYLDDSFTLVELNNTCHGLADAVFRPGYDHPSGKQCRSALVVGNIHANPDLFPKNR